MTPRIFALFTISMMLYGIWVSDINAYMLKKGETEAWEEFNFTGKAVRQEIDLPRNQWPW